MCNYLMSNGEKIEPTDKQVKKIKESFGIGKVRLSDVGESETFKIGEYEFIVLEQFGDSAAVLLKNLLYTNEKFGSNNNYDGSNADKLCNEFASVIEKIVGADNLIKHIVDLTADDGLKCYGNIERKTSLLTAEQYRKYVYTIDKYRLDKWWWLSTAYSTSKHEDTTWIKCVSPSGYIYCDYVYYDDGGVRPFCILKSNIFVSK